MFPERSDVRPVPVEGLERFGTTTAADGLLQMQRFIRPFWLSHALVLVTRLCWSIIDGLNLDEPER
jgi:hypothetical protein